MANSKSSRKVLVENPRGSSSWTCPDCEVQNEGAECDFCGLSVPVQIEKIIDLTVDWPSTSLKPTEKAKSSVTSKGKARSKRNAVEEEEEVEDQVKQRKKINNNNKKQKLDRKAASPVQQKHQGVSTIWSDKYTPQTSEELGKTIDKNRVEQVRFSIKQAIDAEGPRLIILHGPTGAGKSTTARVIGKELNLETREWTEDSTSAYLFRRSGNSDIGGEIDDTIAVGQEGVGDSFNRFLHTCLYPPLALTSKQSNGAATSRTAGTLVLLEGLPQLKAEKVTEIQRVLFHSLQKLQQNRALKVAVVFILTVDGSSGASPAQLRNALGEQNLMYAQQIGFNEIPPKRLERSLKAVADAEGIHIDPSDITASLGEGDIRAAINSLQFLTIGMPPFGDASTSKSKRTSKSSKQSKGNSTAAEKVSTLSSSRRDENLEMCHAVGKLIRGQKQGEPPFSPESVARNCALDSLALGQFVFENFYKYASAGDCGLDAYLEMSEYLCLTDTLLHEKWSHLERSGGEDDVEASEAFAESILSRGACCWSKYSPKMQQGMSLGTLIQVTRPQTYDLSKEISQIETSARRYLRTRMDSSSPSQFMVETLPLGIKAVDSFDAFASYTSFLHMERGFVPAHRSTLDEDLFMNNPSVLLEEAIEDD